MSTIQASIMLFIYLFWVLSVMSKNPNNLYLQKSTNWLSGFFSYEVMWFRRRRKTSVPSALERRGSATRAARSTVWSLTSCAREETSPNTTAPGASPSTATSLKTKTLHWSTPDLVIIIYFLICLGSKDLLCALFVWTVSYGEIMI